MNHSEIRRKERLAEVREFAEENQIPVQNIQLLNTALTHTSYANEHKNEVIHDNERLEFLGDAVLDLVVGEYLFLRFPSWPEGELTRAKASAVCKPACAECAAKFQVGKYMRLGKGEELSGGRTRISILGDAFEAVIGAIYLDNNYEVAARFILGHLKKFLDLIDQGDYDKNRAVYRLLETHRSEIETAYGKALTWVCQEGVRGCRIYDKMPEVSITNEADWEAMCSFHSQQAKKLLSVVQPFLV